MLGRRLHPFFASARGAAIAACARTAVVARAPCLPCLPSAQGKVAAAGAAAAAVAAAFAVARQGSSRHCLADVAAPAVNEDYCPQAGEWRLDKSRSESMRPFFTGLGVPGFAARIVDAIPVELRISKTSGWLEVTDRTLFGENTTRVALGAEEVKKATRTKRKHFMLSATEKANSEGRPELSVNCRLFERGDGWASAQTWVAIADDSLEERYTLRRPGEEDIVVVRKFQRMGQAPSSGASSAVTAAAATITMRDRYGDANLAAGIVAAVAVAALACGWWTRPAQRPGA